MKPLVSYPGMHHGTCVTHVPWCMSGSLTRGDGENVPGIPGACAIRNFAYLVRGPLRRLHVDRIAVTSASQRRIECNQHDMLLGLFMMVLLYRTSAWWLLYMSYWIVIVDITRYGLNLLTHVCVITVGYHIAFYGANLRHQLIFLTSPAAKWIPDRPTIQIRAENSLGKGI